MVHLIPLIIIQFEDEKTILHLFSPWFLFPELSDRPKKKTQTCNE